MKPFTHLVVFALDQQRLAVPLEVVERVVLAVAITPVPQAPASVLGVINVQGQVLPVFNLRCRFHLPERAIALSDHLLIARTAQRAVALLVDTVHGVLACSDDEPVPAAAITPGLAYVAGVLIRPDGLILLHDLDTFLVADEAAQLEAALRHE